MKERNEYSTVSKFLHWLIAVLVLGMLSFGFFLNDIPDAYQGMAYMFHKSFGLSIMGLMIIRFFVLLYCGKPPLPPITPFWELVLSRFVQYSFYLLLLCMPLCGWIMSVAAGKIPSFFCLFNVPLPIAPSKPLAELMFQFHQTIAWILIALISLHILGALKHYFVNKDQVLQRML